MPQRPTAAPDRAGSTVLIVDDDALIALHTEDLLTAAGFDVLGPAPSVPKALEILSENMPDAAVLDVNLGSQASTPVAEVLTENAIPFVVASGNAALPDDPVFDGVPLLGKPVDPHHLVTALSRLLRFAQRRAN